MADLLAVFGVWRWDKGHWGLVRLTTSELVAQRLAFDGSTPEHECEVREHVLHREAGDE